MRMPVLRCEFFIKGFCFLSALVNSVPFGSQNAVTFHYIQRFGSSKEPVPTSDQGSESRGPKKASLYIQKYMFGLKSMARSSVSYCEDCDCITLPIVPSSVDRKTLWSSRSI